MQGAAPSPKSIASVIDREVYFWSKHGESYMVPGVANPLLEKRVGEKSRFIIRKADDEPILDANFAVDPNSVNVSIERAHRDGAPTGAYLSCRRKCRLTNSSLAEYRAKVGEFETFVMTYCEADNSFLFRSHNDLFLHYNHKFFSCAFKSCSDRQGGFPVKGRWDLLFEDETTGTGTKSGAIQIPLTLAQVCGAMALNFVKEQALDLVLGEE